MTNLNVKFHPHKEEIQMIHIYLVLLIVSILLALMCWGSASHASRREMAGVAIAYFLLLAAVIAARLW